MLRADHTMCPLPCQDDIMGEADAAAGFDVDVGDGDDDLFSSGKGSSKGKQAKKGKKQQAAAAVEEAGEEPAAAAEADAGLNADGMRVLGISKKDPVQRRRELLGPAKGGLAALLLQLCAEGAGSMLRDQAACDVVVECCRGGDDGELRARLPAACGNPSVLL
jgi:hypothetical protein